MSDDNQDTPKIDDQNHDPEKDNYYAVYHAKDLV